MFAQLSLTGGDTVPVFDEKKLGKRIRTARKIADFEKADDFAAALNRRFGSHISGATIRAIERGERTVTAEDILEIAILTDPPNGLLFFQAAVMPTEVSDFEHVVRDG